ncbi:hypothetical protein LINPERHAP2_LOCUS34074 [Linum perenne]
MDELRAANRGIKNGKKRWYCWDIKSQGRKHEYLNEYNLASQAFSFLCLQSQLKKRILQMQQHERLSSEEARRKMPGRTDDAHCYIRR